MIVYHLAYSFICLSLIGLDSLDFASKASRSLYFSYALWARNLNYLNYIVCPLIGLDGVDFASKASRSLYFSYALWARNLNYLNYLVCPLIGLDSLDFLSPFGRTTISRAKRVGAYISPMPLGKKSQLSKLYCLSSYWFG